MKILLISILILASSCKSQKNLSQEIDDNGLTLLVQDGYFYTDTSETAVIKDEKALKAFFSRVNRTRKPGIPLPKVDFSKELVLIACTGEQKTTALPYLKMAENKDEETIIEVKMEDKSGQAIAYPFCVYKMPIVKNNIVFKSF
ncbi:hypothetical protein ACFSQJ_14845 [Croceitalea marina]|uniref:Uncharacterized protein n=1 Tax=Croceitalea marina TaxID=1775166 RepID=A0ABW5MY14_9FLAO